MIPDSAGTVVPGHRAAAGIAAAILMLSAPGLAGCGAVKAVSTVRHDVAGNKGTIDEFTNTLKASQGTTFEAAYMTTGTSPSTIVYAVKPPQGLAFKSTPSGSRGGGGSDSDIVANSSGEYSCSLSSGASSWSCQKLGTASAAVHNGIFGFYTPAHWVAFLKGFSFAVGFAGASITSSDMTVNGFHLRCVDFHAPGIKGKSTICTTAQGILGYVKIAQDPTQFEITAYSASPPASLFDLPPGAKVTTS